MTPALYECVEMSLRAERAGDFATALDWYRTVPMFAGNRHGRILEDLAGWGPDLPPWVWMRYLSYTATRCEDGDTGGLVRGTLRVMVETAHGDLLQACFERGGDPVRVGAQVMGESWAYQQTVLGVGALLAFLDEHAEGRLAEHGDLARQWAAAPMSGYQLGQSLPGARLQVREAGAVDWTEVLDLGARTGLCLGGWVLGRLVPSGVDDRLMFDMAPLPVPEQLARDVAATTGGGRWSVPLATAQLERRISSDSYLREGYEIGSDVQEIALIEHSCTAAQRSVAVQNWREGRDERRRAAFRLLRRASEGQVVREDQALVAAAALVVQADADVRRTLVRPGQPESWRKWASLVPEPARQRLLTLADLAVVAA